MATPKIINQQTKPAALQRFDHILKKASEKKASDIHLKIGLPPIVRVNGVLYYLKEHTGVDATPLQMEELQEISFGLMNPHQANKYTSGNEVDLGYELLGAGRFRINICQQRAIPRLVCRLIPETVRTIQELLLPQIVQDLALTPRGLILVTGATGSGKSSTLAAMIDHITRVRSCHIVTIEDPIEFTFKDRKSIVTQREVGSDSPTFKAALKYALRQDPDVILVGEMRDEETILMALMAAETGHLVLSTLHTTDATESINRILGSVSVGHQEQARLQLASVLVAVISQRLVIKKDRKSRLPAVEILLNNQRTKELIADPDRTTEIRRVIEESSALGMLTFDQSLMELYQKNLITQEEALLNCTNPKDFELRLRGVLSTELHEKEELSSLSNVYSAIGGTKSRERGSTRIELDQVAPEVVSEPEGKEEDTVQSELPPKKRKR